MAVPVKSKVEAPNPFLEAQRLKGLMRSAIRTNTPFQITTMPEVLACMIQMPTALWHDFNQSVNIHRVDDQVALVIGSDETIIQNAVQHWYNFGKQKSPTSLNKFNITMYLSAYRLIQATVQGKGQEEIQNGLSKFFFSVLEGQANDEFLVGLGRIIGSKGEIPSIDDINIHRAMQSLWDRIPDEVKNAYDGYNPRNLFTSLG